MSLRIKTAIIAIAVILGYVGISIILRFGVFLPGFRALEEHEGREDAARVMAALQREMEYLDSFCQDWAAWNDTYDFVQDGNKAYEETNMADATFQQNRLNLIFVLDKTGAVVFGRACELNDSPKGPLLDLSLPDFPTKRWSVSHALLEHDGVTSKIVGVMRTSHGPMLVSARPITTTEQQGPVRGTLIMGRFLNEDLVQLLRQQTRLRVRIDVLDAAAESVPVYPADSTRAFTFEEASPSVLVVSMVFPDVFGKPLLRLRVETVRDIMQKGEEVVRLTTWARGATAIVVVTILLVFFQRTMLGPLLVLTRHVARIAKEEDLVLIDTPVRRDEIGALTTEFNRMVRRIQSDNAERRRAEAGMQEMQAKLLRAEHLATLGEMGASIAHEIRNPLTGISSALQVLRVDFAEDDARREIMEEVLAQTRRMDLIVSRLLMFAKSWEPARVPTDLRALAAQIFDDAAKTDAYAGIRLIVEAGDPVLADVDPALIDSVLQNLVSNAADALHAAMPVAPEIRCSFGQTFQTTSIVLHDNGGGIPEDVQPLLFHPFFTTKTYGTGLGLVICRRVVESHGGTITLTSAPGQGTDVTVTFPKES